MTPILTYTLTQQCGPSRPFCRPCANSFTVQSCGPTHCEVEPPSQICLAPALGGFIDDSQGYCGYPDCATTMPEQWIVVIEWPDLEDTPGFPYTLTNTTAGRIELIGDTFFLPDNCGVIIAFHSEIYPLYDVETSHPNARDFQVTVRLNSSFHGLVELYNERIGVAKTSIGNFGPHIDRRIATPGEAEPYCTDHNHAGTFTIIPRELPFGGGPYPQLPITISIYPRVS